MCSVFACRGLSFVLLFRELFEFFFLIFSIGGENKHYGTPTNPAAPARVPGGASSGAAVAVAANFVDFALGEFLHSLFIAYYPFLTCKSRLH